MKVITETLELDQKKTGPFFFLIYKLVILCKTNLNPSDNAFEDFKQNHVYLLQSF